MLRISLLYVLFLIFFTVPSFAGEEISAVEVQNKESISALVEMDPVLGTKSWETLDQGTKLNYLSSETWHKVKLPGGQIAWLSEKDLEGSLENLEKGAYKNYLSQNYKTALQEYLLLSQFPKSFKEADLWLAKIHWKLNQASGAAFYLNKAKAVEDLKSTAAILSQTYAQELFKIARLKLRKNDFKSAASLLESAVKFKPDSSLISEKLIFCYQQLNNEEALRNYWQKVLKNDPLNSAALAYFGFSKTGNVVFSKPQVEEKKALSSPAPTKKEAIAETKVTPKIKEIADNPVAFVQQEKTTKGTPIKSALNSVVNLTESFGTIIKEKKWIFSKKGRDNYVVSFICLQDQSGQGKNVETEYFHWQVNLKTKDFSPLNKNAQLLMKRW